MYFEYEYTDEVELGIYKENLSGIVIDSKNLSTKWLSKNPNIFTNSDRVECLILYDFEEQEVHDEIFKLYPNVLELDLSDNKFSKIPSFSRMENLKILNISNLKLNQLPDSIGNLNLSELDVSHNFFYKFPPSILEISTLKVLIADKCNLNEIPESFAKLVNLVKFTASRNNITDIPENFYLNICGMKWLDLSENKIALLSPLISKLHDLKILIINYNQLSAIPPSIGSLKNLRKFVIGHNNIDVLPEELTKLENLHIFDARKNCLKFIKFDFSRMISLKYLNLACNKIIELPDLSLPESLTHLVLGFNEILEISIHSKEFSAIKRLNLCYNKISSIPSGIFELTRLEYIDLSCNNGTVKIIGDKQSTVEYYESLNLQTKILIVNGNSIPDMPRSFAHMKNLTRLCAENCKISTLPDVFSFMIHLEHLSLKINELRHLPEQMFIHMPSLAYLNVSDNQLCSLPHSFSCLIKLKEFLAYGNVIESLPEKFGNLSNLESIDLGGNKIAKLPDDFSKLNKLRRLNLYNNSLEYIDFEFEVFESLYILDLGLNNLKMFPKISNNCKLIELILIDNKINEIPKSFHLQFLEDFNIANNCVNQFFSGLFRMPNLKNIDIESNNALLNIEDYDFDNVPINLQKLRISGNKLHILPPEIMKMKKLEEFIGRECHISNFSSGVYELDNIQNFDVSFNNISILPDSIFERLKSLTCLDLSNNELTKIPDSISYLKSLTKLMASHNELRFVPAGIGELTNLEYLHLNKNSIDILPESLSNLKKLKFINLSGNKLVGFENKLSSLKKINLSNNRIRSFPDFSNCTSLKELDIGENFLKNIPSSIWDLPKLRRFNFSHNDIRIISELKVINLELKLEFYNNPITWPPINVLYLGMEGIQQFYADLTERKSLVQPNIKLLLLGNSFAGKTTLCLRMCGKSDKSVDRTRVIEKSSFTLTEGNDKLIVSVFDLAGQEIYDSTHKIFFSNNALYFLIIDLYEFCPNNFHHLVGRWIDMLVCYIENSHIVCIFSHVDKFKNKDSIRKKRADVENQINVYLSKTSCLSKSQKANILGYVEMNCKKIDDKGYLVLTNMIKECTFKKSLLPLVYEVPYSWKQFSTLLLEDPSNVYIDWPCVEKYAKWSKISNIDVVLEYESLCGNILYLKKIDQSLVVFHRPLSLILSLRSIFMHDFQAVWTENTIWNKLFGSKKETLLMKLTMKGKLCNLTECEVEAAFTMMKNGIFPIPFLESIFENYFGEKVDVKIIIDFLQKFKYCFRMKDSEMVDSHYHDPIKSIPKICLPCYFLKDIPQKTIDSLYHKKLNSEGKELELRFMIYPFIKSLWPEIVTLLHEHSSYFKIVWKYGLIAAMGIVNALFKVKRTESENMLMTVYLSIPDQNEIKEVSQTFWCIHTCLTNHFKTYVGLSYTIELICDKCKVGAFILTKPLAEKTICNKCNKVVPVGKLLHSSKIQKKLNYTLTDVAFYLQNDQYAQKNWELLSDMLEVGHLKNDIMVEVSTKYGAPYPSRCLYLLILKWGFEKQVEDCVEKLFQQFDQIPELTNTSESLRAKMVSWSEAK